MWCHRPATQPVGGKDCLANHSSGSLRVWETRCQYNSSVTSVPAIVAAMGPSASPKRTSGAWQTTLEFLREPRESAIPMPIPAAVTLNKYSAIEKTLCTNRYALSSIRKRANAACMRRDRMCAGAIRMETSADTTSGCLSSGRTPAMQPTYRQPRWNSREGTEYGRSFRRLTPMSFRWLRRGDRKVV
jgi:hypothetical protein